MKPRGKAKLEWSPDFAYAIGLITTDGCLANDGRHLDLCSKDKDLLVIFRNCLGLKNKISSKISTYTGKGDNYHVQFGDVLFYRFLQDIGLHSAKSKTLGSLTIPDKYFADFLRGCIDGDGNISAIHHPESSHLQLRVRLTSASPDFLAWVHAVIGRLYAIKGGWIQSGGQDKVWTLAYGKSDGILLLNQMYYPGVSSFLQRKFVQARPYLEPIISRG